MATWGELEKAGTKWSSLEEMTWGELEEFCTVNPKTKQIPDDMEVSFVPMQSVSDTGDVQTDEVRKASEVKKGFTFFEEGDVLFAKITPCMENGKGGIARGLKNSVGFGSTEFHVLHPDPEKVSSEWLYYLTSWDEFRKQCARNMTGSAGQKRVPKSYLEHYKVHLPPLEEQRRIAATLDKVSDLIAKRRAQLDKLDLLVKARFVEIFGDLAAPECPHKKCKLVETCVSSDDIKCGPFGTQLSKEEYQDHGVAVWEIPQINSYFTTQPTHFLTVEKAEQLKAYSIIPGDIAMSRKGNVGRCARFPDNFDSGIIHSDVLRIRVNKQQVNPCFMMYQLHFSGAVQRQIEVVSSGAIMAGVNVTKLKHIEIHLPDFDLQQQFAHFVGEVDSVKCSINNSLEKLETLKKALMQEYFG